MVTGSTLGEIDLPPIRGRIENHWTLHELGLGVVAHYWSRPFNWPGPDLSDCLAARLPGRPWLLQLWEPLHTKAPSPARCQPYCCYSRTVIFYHRPYVLGHAHPWKGNGRWHWEKTPGFAQFDQIDTRLGWDDQVKFDGDVFEVSGGMVHWHHRRWWMHYGARRKAPA